MNIKFIVALLVMVYLASDLLYSQNQTTKTDLMNIGAISVTIGGSFPINGTYPAFITERVDAFVSRMYAQAVDLTMGVTSDPDIYRKLKEELDNFAMRGINLKRASGEVLPIDLQRFRLTGDFKYNPYLKNDDVIIFPPFDLTRNFFSVWGVVNSPGTFQYIEGDNLGDALELVNGINFKADQNIEKRWIQMQQKYNLKLSLPHGKLFFSPSGSFLFQKCLNKQIFFWRTCHLSRVRNFRFWVTISTDYGCGNSFICLANN